ncbi:ribokinase [Treponema sp.]|uniref:ribokinase n=1 Tax=Treponema sp. TaxID=166 RepID=UPI00388FB38C
MKVLSFGSLNIDSVYKVDHIVTPGETQLSFEINENCGGKGLNQSIALARAGAEVYHAGMVGNDGDILIKKCLENGVNAEFIKKTKGRSGHTIIQVDKKGNNSIILCGGANRCMTEEFIDEVLSHFESGDFLILQNEINLLDKIIGKAYEHRLQIVLNPSPFDDALFKCDMSKISYFILNEIEGRQMTGKTTPEEILKEILLNYPESKTVLTLGEKGSVYKDKNDFYHQDIFKVKAVDTTAAGDTFTGYFIASLIKGLNIKECLSLAAKASSIAVTRNGALDSIPTLDEIE